MHLINRNEDDEEEKKEEKGRDTTQLMQQKLLDARSIIISGEINQALTEKVVTQLLLLQGISDAPIKIYLNSQGGHVEAADTIHDMIKFITPEVHIIGTGWVASAGITIFLAAKKEHRYSLPNTRFMIHQPLGGVRGQASDIEIEAKEIIRTLERVNQLIADATGQPVEKVKQDTDRNYWMNTKEAIDYGIVSRVVKSYRDLNLD